MNQFVFAVYST